MSKNNLSQSHPFPDLEPTFSPLHKAERDDILRYGRFRPVTTYRDTIEEEVKVAKQCNATVLTHCFGTIGHGFKRYQPVEELQQRAAKARPELKAINDAGMLSLPYNAFNSTIKPVTRENWDKVFTTWGHLIDPKFKAPLQDCLFTSHQQRFTKEKNHGYNWLSFDAPVTLEWAKAVISLDVTNGASGCYWDVFSYPPNTCYGKYALNNLHDFIAKQVKPSQAQEIFGAPLNEIVPPAMPMKQELLYQEIHRTTDDVDRVMHAPASDAHVEPSMAAFIRYRLYHSSWFLRELRKHGEGLNDGYTSASTFYIDSAGPHFYSYYFGVNVETFTQGGKAHSFALYEPWRNGPHRGFARGEEHKPFGPKKKNDRGWEPYLLPEVYGRRSNTANLKYMSEASLPQPLAHKTCPNMDEKHLAAQARLGFAENWANLTAQRCVPSPKYQTLEVTERMNGFQARHEDIFIGSKRTDRVAIWCSMQQSWGRRYDTSLATSRMLQDSDIEHRVISDIKINNDELEEFDCLLLSNVRLMTDKQIASLNRFARQKGKSLILIGRNADRDEWDRDRLDGQTKLLAGVPQENVAILDEKIYPRLPQMGAYRIAGQGDDLEPLRKAVQDKTDGAFSYLGKTPESIEVHPVRIDNVEVKGAMTGKGRTVVHVVNYDLDPCTGVETASKPLELRIRIPKDAQSRQATCYFPCEDNSSNVKLDLRMEELQGATYAALTIPPFKTSAIIVIDDK